MDTPRLHCPPAGYSSLCIPFENGSKEGIPTVSSTYLNRDGEFLHALDTDAWKLKSSPISTWCKFNLSED
jgi:hypothetical protein